LGSKTVEIAKTDVSRRWKKQKGKESSAESEKKRKIRKGRHNMLSKRKEEKSRGVLRRESSKKIISNITVIKL